MLDIGKNIFVCKDSFSYSADVKPTVYKTGLILSTCSTAFCMKGP